VEDIQVRDIQARTTNAAISGSFNTSSSLTLSTSNAPIEVDVTAFNHDGIKAFIATTNAQLAANFSLYASPASSAPGIFDVRTFTTNAPLRVNYFESPLYSVLDAKAGTTNSPAYVRLHPAYEGSFTTTTTHFPSTIESLKDVEDPTGHGRVRKVNIDFQIKGVARGSVAWEPLEHERGQPGSVIVSTTNGHLFLTL